jgi:hypothetical protein
MMFNIAMFYMSGAIVVGSLAAGFANHSATWQGKPLNHPRLIGSIVAGALWPATLAQLLFR